MWRTLRPPRLLRALRVPVVAVLAILLAAPLVRADHVYSHRYLVQGRVIDAAGRPLANTLVRVGVAGFAIDSKCDADGRTGYTDEFGDFAYCLHAHDIPAGSTVSINVLGATVSRAADREVRESTFFVTASGANGTALANFSATYLVDGKVWRHTRAGTYEGVPVTGLALPNVTVFVNVTSGGRAYRGTAESDRYGEFRVRFHFDAPLAAGSLTVSALGATASEPLNLTFMRTRVDLKLAGDGIDAGLDSAAASAPAITVARAAVASWSFVVLLFALAVAGIGVVAFVMVWRKGRIR